MPKIIYISDSGEKTEVEGSLGDSVMETAIQNGVDGIVAECGGSCVCATCHVYVDEKFLPLLTAPEETETSMLEYTASERKPNSRLSCQIHITPALDGLTVHTPPTQK
jgi:2Fe-2S ferredoxin